MNCMWEVRQKEESRMASCYLGLNPHEKWTCYFLRWNIVWLDQVWGFENNPS